VDVGLFQDGNDDGTGDFQGMVGRLDYLARLGAATIWRDVGSMPCRS
jgi:maltose alpha-D-glucosyltransferase/alpha-amylase